MLTNKNILKLKWLKVLKCKVYIQLASNRTAKGRYGSYITRKISYIKMLNRIRIVKLSREPLSITYRGKEKNILLAKI